MADVLSPPTPTAATTSHEQLSDSADSMSAARPRERVPSYAQNRMSTYSQRTSRSHSRPQSSVNISHPSSLSYAEVRDFAYPSYHPFHYGTPLDPPSGMSTPGSEMNSARRLSDPADASNGGGAHGSWTHGPWGGDGSMYGEPEQEVEALPSTSFANDPVPDWSRGAPADDGGPAKKSKHRKSKSYANTSDFERGRHRESSGSQSHQNSRSNKDSDMFYFSSSTTATAPPRSDPAGRDSLRQDRGLDHSSTHDSSRRDSPVNPPAGTSSQTSWLSPTPNNNHHHHRLNPSAHSTSLDPYGNPLSAIPLDIETSSPLYAPPRRHSVHPEDEELFAGPSLALYSFEPENSNELRLTEGCVVLVAYRHGQGWLVAQDPQTGEQGLIPEAYVRLLRDIEGWDAERGGFVDDEDGDEEEGEGEDDTTQSHPTLSLPPQQLIHASPTPVDAHELRDACDTTSSSSIPQPPNSDPNPPGPTGG